MDNVLVGTENEEKHDKIVKEILRRIKANNLYIKPEKCVCITNGHLLICDGCFDT